MTTHEDDAPSPSELGMDDATDNPHSPPPLQVRLKEYDHPDWGDMYFLVRAAERFQFGMRVENMAAFDGPMCVEVTIYDELPIVDCQDAHSWWPKPRGWTTWHGGSIGDEDLRAAMTDPRWETHQARAYYLGVPHRHWCCALGSRSGDLMRQEWYVDFSDLELAGDLDYQSFPMPSSEERVMTMCARRPA